jgi:hypothetical protein
MYSVEYTEYRYVTNNVPLLNLMLFFMSYTEKFFQWKIMHIYSCEIYLVIEFLKIQILAFILL